jgi:hypothetical protein
MPQAAPAAPPAVIDAQPDEAEPYALALGRLEAAAAELRRTGDVARHYETVADTLRDYLEAYGIPARERTTTELRWSMPPALLADAAGRRFAALFEAADLVKFAHWQPDAAHAETFLRWARELLTRWHAARAADAVSAAGAESA